MRPGRPDARAAHASGEGRADGPAGVGGRWPAVAIGGWRRVRPHAILRP